MRSFLFWLFVTAVIEALVVGAMYFIAQSAMESTSWELRDAATWGLMAFAASAVLVARLYNLPALEE